MLNVALSSRSLYHLSKSFIYRDLHFTFNRSRRNLNGRLIKQLLTDDDLSTKVQEIRILWAPSPKLQPGEGSKEDLDSLGRALPRLTRLKTFIWDAQYPIVSGLLETLEKHHPQCLLYTRHPASGNSAWTLPRLCASPCLFSFNVTLTTGQFQASKELQNVLISAPKLRDLTIHSADISIDQLQGSLKLLHLRSLELYGGDDLFFFKFPVAWSMLERLSIDTVTLGSTDIPELSCLKSLRLRVPVWGILQLSNFLQNCKKLEVLDLIGCTRDMQTAKDSFWESVGKTLIALRLHEGEEEPPRDKPLLSLNDMRRIARNCRKLRSLGLDLACNGQEWVSSSSASYYLPIST